LYSTKIALPYIILLLVAITKFDLKKLTGIVKMKKTNGDRTCYHSIFAHGLDQWRALSALMILTFKKFPTAAIAAVLN